MSRWSRRKREALGEKNPGDEEKESEDKPTGSGGEAKQPCPDIPLNSIIPDGVSGRMQTRTAADQLADERARANAGDADNALALTDDDMPSLDTLDESSDYSGFMSSGVSEKLRRVALRKLFSGAGFNVRDGLDDYDEDYTNFEALGDIITSDMKHRQELEAEKREQAEQQAKEQEDAQITESEGSDSVEAGQDDESKEDIAAENELDVNKDVDKIDKDEQNQSVTLVGNDPDDAGKPHRKKSS